MESSNPVFAIGIPTVNRADLLNEALEKYLVDFPTTKIFIVDNGAQDILVHPSITVMSQEKNIGVAASWNLLCKIIFGQEGLRAALILNDDIYSGLPEMKVRNLILNWPDEDFFTTTGTWCAFVIRKATFERIGPFDEEFYPAYFEDEDYSYRMKLADLSVFKTQSLSPKVFRNSQSIERDRSLNNGYMANHKRYIAKWGGIPGNEGFKKPFNE